MSISLLGVERHGTSVTVATTLITSDEEKIEIMFADGRKATLNRQYIQARAAWIEQFNRAGTWLVDKPRSV